MLGATLVAGFCAAVPGFRAALCCVHESLASQTAAGQPREPTSWPVPEQIVAHVHCSSSSSGARQLCHVCRPVVVSKVQAHALRHAHSRRCRPLQQHTCLPGCSRVFCLQDFMRSGQQETLRPILIAEGEVQANIDHIDRCVEGAFVPTCTARAGPSPPPPLYALSFSFVLVLTGCRRVALLLCAVCCEKARGCAQN